MRFGREKPETGDGVARFASRPILKWAQKGAARDRVFPPRDGGKNSRRWRGHLRSNLLVKMAAAKGEGQTRPGTREFGPRIIAASL